MLALTILPWLPIALGCPILSIIFAINGDYCKKGELELCKLSGWVVGVSVSELASIFLVFWHDFISVYVCGNTRPPILLYCVLATWFYFAFLTGILATVENLLCILQGTEIGPISFIQLIIVYSLSHTLNKEA